MELKNIKYRSAVFFAVFVLIMSLIYGLLQWFARDAILEMYGVPIMASQVLVIIPLVGAIVSYLVMLIAILTYNWVARKWPISWEVKK